MSSLSQITYFRIESYYFANNLKYLTILIETIFPEIPEILYRFIPDDAIIFFDPNSEPPERMIFGGQFSYLPFEEDYLKQLDIELKDSIVRTLFLISILNKTCYFLLNLL